MAAYISFQPSDFFNTLLYTGNGGTNSVTGVGFQPDFTWIKNRLEGDNHYQCDAVRGAGKYIESSTNIAEVTNANGLSAFGSDGFTVGTQGSQVNDNTDSYVSWNWKAGTTSGLSGGTITPSAYSINTTSGFGIYKYTGGSSTDTIAHGLGVAPKMIIIKSLTTTNDWTVYHAALGNDKLLVFNGTGTQVSDGTTWNSTSPTSTVWPMGNSGDVNNSARDYIAYVFAPKRGFSKFGSYVANNNANGPFVYTGFRPSMVFMKNYVNGAWSWQLLDCRREGYNSSNDQVYPNTASAEGSDGYGDLMANGFKITAANSGINDSGATFIYAAFAEFPLVSSNSKAGVAR